MDLAAIETGLRSWLAVTALNVDGATPLPVEFGRRPTKVHTEPFVLVYLGPIGTQGHDFPHYEYDELTDELVEQMRGVRRLPVRFSFRAFNQAWGKNARQFAADFRANLQSTASIEALGAAKLALQGSSDLIETDYEFSGKLISQVDMTVDFGCCGYQRSPSTDVGYITTVHLTAEGLVIDEYGNPIYDESGNPVVHEETQSWIVTTDEAP